MPRCPGDGTVIIEEGDSLWKAARYVLVYEGNTSPTNTQIANLVNTIVSLNNISNPNLVYKGQVFKVHQSTSASGSSTAVNKSNAPAITSMGIQSGTDRLIFATWTWEKHSDTKEYEYEYYYDTGDSLEWFHGGGPTSCGTRQHVTFTPPGNAKRVKFMVRAIAKDKEGS